MKRIAVTGGIASGKSTFAQLLGELGAKIIDYDQISRVVLAKGTPATAAIAASFGQDIFDAQGALCRSRLAEIVFADEKELAKLNDITHPFITKLAQESEQKFAAETKDLVIVHDIPLFVGSWLMGQTDYAVLLTAPLDQRIERMVTNRKMNIADARARIAAQMSDAEIAPHVDAVIENTGDLSQLRNFADQLWQNITEDDA
ncbi:dephospho-CoA kinase [Arcanobacterium hippocoleae]|uniref:dephospho-CoA kinase n=1 Tax=Arcanobacterium hippocoleae TaxID=149017 RepID=UPI0033413441